MRAGIPNPHGCQLESEIYIYFFFEIADESAKIPVKSHLRDFYLRGTRVCSYGIYFNIGLMHLSDRLCKKI